jgi:hypothetical protein
MGYWVMEIDPLVGLFGVAGWPARYYWEHDMRLVRTVCAE